MTLGESERQSVHGAACRIPQNNSDMPLKPRHFSLHLRAVPSMERMGLCLVRLGEMVPESNFQRTEPSSGTKNLETCNLTQLLTVKPANPDCKSQDFENRELQGCSFGAREALRLPSLPVNSRFRYIAVLLLRPRQSGGCIFCSRKHQPGIFKMVATASWCFPRGTHPSTFSIAWDERRE